MKLCSSVLMLLLVLFFAATILSQTPTPTSQSSSEDVVKISTTLIQIDATVLDKKGKPVKGLTADDFEIYENNKKQQITNFSYVEIEPAKSAEPVVAKTDKSSLPVPPVPARLRPEQVHRTLALVVDDLGLSVPSIDVVKSALKKFVDEQMQPGDVVAIIRTGSGAGALQQFTSDKRILYAAIARVHWNPHGRGGISVFQAADPSDMGASQIKSMIEEDLSPEVLALQARGRVDLVGSQRQSSQYNEDIFSVGTLGAVNYVVKGMRELPGRKAVVLLSDGFALYAMDKGIKKPNPRLIDNFQRLTELANRSSVIIYTMDARGVVNPLLADAQDSFENFIGSGNASANQRISVVEQLGLDRSTELFESQEGLRALAEQTGGFAVINNNNLSKGIERILNDQTGYYLLGYQPNSESFDAKKVRFNKLTVKVMRPDVHVRYRSGFFNIKDEDARPQLKTPRQQIFAALTSPFSSGEIDLRLTSLLADEARTGIFMRSLLYVNGADLKFIEEADGWHRATFDIVAMIFGDNGTIVDEVSRTETIKAKVETLRELRAKGFVSTITVPIKKPGAYQMRVVMRDASSGRIGSASQFVEVPNLKKDRLTLSGILLRRLQKSANVSGQRQFQPDEQRDFARRRFHLGDTIRFDLSIYNARIGKTANANLMVQYRVFRHGKEIFMAPGKVLALSEPLGLGSIDSSGMFELGKKMPVGDYVLQVIVKDLQAVEKRSIATQWTDFEIVK